MNDDDLYEIICPYYPEMISQQGPEIQPQMSADITDY